MVPWAHSSPPPKGHLDRFSRFCADFVLRVEAVIGLTVIVFDMVFFVYRLYLLFIRRLQRAPNTVELGGLYCAAIG